MTSLHGFLFKSIEKFWHNLRRFCFRNRTVFEIVFILIYAFEQVGLVLFVYQNPDNIQFIVSIFAIIVLTTFALHKVLMESRIKMLEDEMKSLLIEKSKLEFNNEYIIKEHDELINYIDKYIGERIDSPKDLNSQRAKNNKKGVKR